jgi:hypothetical protein
MYGSQRQSDEDYSKPYPWGCPLDSDDEIEVTMVLLQLRTSVMIPHQPKLCLIVNDVGGVCRQKRLLSGLDGHGQQMVIPLCLPGITQSLGSHIPHWPKSCRLLGSM